MKLNAGFRSRRGKVSPGILPEAAIPLSGKRVGFTLIELLVVIAILGILAALLLTAIPRGTALARKTSCLSRMKQWSIALMMYAQENDDSIPRESFIPGGTTINFWAQVQNPLAVDVWYNALPKYANGRQAAAYAPLAVRADYYHRNKLFHCPGARFPKHAASGEVALFSFAMNSKLILTPYWTIKLASIDQPSATVTFLDNRLPDEPKVHPKQENGHLGQPSAYATRFVARHLQSGTLAFADGHLETKRGSEVVESGGAKFPQSKIVWTGDPEVNPNVVN